VAPYEKWNTRHLNEHFKHKHVIVGRFKMPKIVKIRKCPIFPQVFRVPLLPQLTLRLCGVGIENPEREDKKIVVSVEKPFDLIPSNICTIAKHVWESTISTTPRTTPNGFC